MASCRLFSRRPVTNEKPEEKKEKKRLRVYMITFACHESRFPCRDLKLVVYRECKVGTQTEKAIRVYRPTQSSVPAFPRVHCPQYDPSGLCNFHVILFYFLCLFFLFCITEDPKTGGICTREPTRTSSTFIKTITGATVLTKGDDNDDDDDDDADGDDDDDDDDDHRHHHHHKF